MMDHLLYLIVFFIYTLVEQAVQVVVEVSTVRSAYK